MPVRVDVLENSPLDLVPSRCWSPCATASASRPTSTSRGAPARCRRSWSGFPTTSAGATRSCRRSRPFFTDRGYAFVVQDVRGKFRSEGATVAFVYEVEDGYDTLEWLASQPWCDGNVGMWGDSYYGFTQWAAVASRHPALKAIVPRVTSADLGGRFGPETIVPLYMGEYLANYWLDHRVQHWDVDYGHRPLSEVFDPGFEAVGRRSESFDRFVEESVRGRSLMTFPDGHPFEALRIPVLHTGGWFDNLMPDQMRDYDTLIARPEVAGLQYLEMDSTDHENYHLELVPIGPRDDHDSNDEALARMLPRYLGSALDFFDRFLKGMAGDIPRVRWHQGNDGWRTAESWPPPGARELRLHLSAADRAIAGAEGGRLSAAPDAEPSVARWVHDPADLVPSTRRGPVRLPAGGPGRAPDRGSPGRPRPSPRMRSTRHSIWWGPSPCMWCDVHRALDGAVREARRRRPGGLDADADAGPDDGSRSRSDPTRSDRPRAHGVPRAARPSPAAPTRLERLPALPAVPRHRRGPVAGGDWTSERADPAGRRGSGGLPLPDGRRLNRREGPVSVPKEPLDTGPKPQKVRFVVGGALVLLLVFGGLLGLNAFRLRGYAGRGPVCRVASTEPFVALTFDDGPDPVYTPEVLQLLRSEGVKATFFLLGQHAMRFPKLVSDVQAAGMEVGNHTWSHPHLPDETPTETELEINRTERALQTLGVTSDLFRAPYGELTPAQLDT